MKFGTLLIGVAKDLKHDVDQAQVCFEAAPLFS